MNDPDEAYLMFVVKGIAPVVIALVLVVVLCLLYQRMDDTVSRPETRTSNHTTTTRSQNAKSFSCE